MSNENTTSIVIDSVSLDFPVMYNSSLQIRNLFKGNFRKIFKREKFTAINNLSFNVEKGEVLGVIGPNGAGKSTLLRLLSGIYVPSAGKVLTRGNISLLAGVGAGFQANLTGRQNIFLSGSIYGIPKKELKRLEQSIIDFSEIEKFIDQPLRTYSSGMKARLAFSIATNLKPDILLIDEVIAVGDSSFKKKSMAKIKEMVASDCTVVIISHSQSLLEMICDRILCLHKGRLDCLTDDKKFAVNRYHELSKKG